MKRKYKFKQFLFTILGEAKKKELRDGGDGFVKSTRDKWQPKQLFVVYSLQFLLLFCLANSFSLSDLYLICYLLLTSRARKQYGSYEPSHRAVNVQPKIIF